MKQGIELIFVLDGQIPDIKVKTVVKRLGGNERKNTKLQRRQLNSKFQKCCKLFDHLNIPWIKASEEAEAICAALNQFNVVDACITNDSDVFLYGAKTVYKNFKASQKKITYTSYNMKHVEEYLGMNRRSLIALGLLLGCDYDEHGISGIGKIQGVKLIESWKGCDALDKMKNWRYQKNSSDYTSSKLEEKIRNLAMKIDGFPDLALINEFQKSRRDFVEGFKQNKKQIKAFNLCAYNVWEVVSFLVNNLSWVDEYALNTIFPLLTDMFLRKIDGKLKNIYLEKIVADRIRDKQQVFECIWKINKENSEKVEVITFESRDRLQSFFPEAVSSYWKEKTTKKNKKKKTKSKVDELLKSLQEMNLSDSSKQASSVTKPHEKIKEDKKRVFFEESDSDDNFDDKIVSSHNLNEDTPLSLQDDFNSPIKLNNNSKLDASESDEYQSPVFMTLAERLAKKRFPKLD